MSCQIVKCLPDGHLGTIHLEQPSHTFKAHITGMSSIGTFHTIYTVYKQMTFHIKESPYKILLNFTIELPSKHKHLARPPDNMNS